MAKQLVSSEDEAKEKGTGEKPAIQPDLSVHELPKDYHADKLGMLVWQDMPQM